MLIGFYIFNIQLIIFLCGDELFNRMTFNSITKSNKGKLYRYNQSHNMSHLDEIVKSPMLYNLDKGKYDYPTMEVSKDRESKLLHRTEMNSRKQIYDNIMQRKLDYQMK